MLFVSGLPAAWTNGVVGARLTPDSADARIAWARARLEEAGVPGSWQVGPATTPADLPDRLLGRGLTEDEPLPWMAAPLPERPADAPLPEGLTVEEVRTPALHDAWLTAMVEGFGSDDAGRETLDRLGRQELEAGDGSWIRFVGLVDGRPACSSGLYVAGGVAGIYNVTTLAEMRRRGFATAMSLIAMRQAWDLGHRIVVLGASDEGRHVYEVLRFRDACVTRSFTWPDHD